MRIFFTRREGLYRMNVNPGEFNVKKLTDGKFLYGIDYDYANHLLFWTERDEHAVSFNFLLNL